MPTAGLLAQRVDLVCIVSLHLRAFPPAQPSVVFLQGSGAGSQEAGFKIYKRKQSVARSGGGEPLARGCAGGGRVERAPGHVQPESGFALAP